MMINFMSTAALFHLLVFTIGFVSVLSAADERIPQQIHLAFGNDPSEIVVTWNTVANTNKSVVQFGQKSLTSVSYGNQVELGGPTGILQHIQYVHKVVLSGLKPGTSHVYRCGCPGSWSKMFNFTTMKDGNDWSPRFAVYGDMGFVNAKSVPWLLKDIQHGMIDAILHVGDFAYDMSDDEGEVGDNFMNLIQPIAANIPYMTCVGNHEFHYNFTNYKTRFAMPTTPGDGEGFFYSFNIGPAHIISLSTEFYFFITYGIKQVQRQFDWLMQDLAEANKPENRAKHPWIITMGHRPMYCSNNAAEDCSRFESIVRVGVPFLHLYGMEPLFYKYGVDLAIWAHEHSYERFWPVYDRKVYNGSYNSPYTNPKATVHITTGSAGCREKLDPFVEPKPEWSAFRTADYGYTRMKIYNASHLYLEQFSVDQPNGGAVVDKIMLIKDHHGPYKP